MSKRGNTIGGLLGIAATVAALALSGNALGGLVEDTAQADKDYAGGDVVGAMALYRRAADAGHAPAQVKLAAILDASENDAEAFALYQKAAAQNFPGGLHGVGLMHAKGEGTRKDFAEALKWYRRAAAMDHLPSVEAIAWAYLVGDLGLAPDRAEAEAWGDHVVRLGGVKPALRATAGKDQATGKGGAAAKGATPAKAAPK